MIDNCITDMQVEYERGGECSLFGNCFDKIPLKNISLEEFVTDFSKANRERVGQVRDCQDEVQQKKMKLKLPAVTPAGVFTVRRADCLREYSGFLSIDIDGLEGMTNRTKLLLEGFPGLAYCGLSVRGNGLFCLVKIENPARYSEHLEALFEDLKMLGLKPDPACKDISRLRIVSYDPDPILDFSVNPYRKLKAPQQYNRVRGGQNKGAIAERVERCLAQIEREGLDITSRYEDWLALAYALGNEFGEAGRPYFHDISRFYPRYNPKETDRTFSACLKGTETRIGTFFWLCKRYGVKW